MIRKIIEKTKNSPSQRAKQEKPTRDIRKEQTNTGSQAEDFRSDTDKQDVNVEWKPSNETR